MAGYAEGREDGALDVVQRLDPEQSKAAILEAARTLFAQRGFSAVSVRDVAEAAGVTHGLVHHHFGSKNDLAIEVVRRETLTAGQGMMLAATADDWKTVGLPRAIRYYLTEGRTSVLLIMRAEIDGLMPESMLAEDEPRSLGVLAATIGQMQAEGDARERTDPAIVAAYIGAAVFTFATMAPWLLSAVGLKPEEYEARLDEIVELSSRLIRVSG
ncbi:MAG: hypothetical protein CVT59_04575 [Actinobacteria bacterium HGW-Actinobacteria-1]|nr:MAG: hypothetical protein CVT59_04575 [Actinobacteria bacterium HGW-Actinobacteria-1]